MKAIFGLIAAAGLAALSFSTAEAGYRSYGHSGHSYGHHSSYGHSYGYKRHYGHRHHQRHYGHRTYHRAPAYKYVPTYSHGHIYKPAYVPSYGHGYGYAKPRVVIVRPTQKPAAQVEPQVELKSATGVVNVAPAAAAADTGTVGAPIGPQVNTTADQAAPAAQAPAADAPAADQQAPGNAVPNVQN